MPNRHLKISSKFRVMLILRNAGVATLVNVMCVELKKWSCPMALFLMVPLHVSYIAVLGSSINILTLLLLQIIGTCIALWLELDHVKL